MEEILNGRSWVTRPEIDRGILTITRKGGHPVILISGPSGSGKSTLINTYLRDFLEKEETLATVKMLPLNSTPSLAQVYEERVSATYPAAVAAAILGSDLGATTPTPPYSMKPLIVLDQFERFPTAYETMDGDSLAHLRKMSDYLRCAAKAANSRVIIVSRKEAYFDHVRFLSDEAKLEYDEIILKGIGRGPSREDLYQKFFTILNSGNKSWEVAYLDNLFTEEVIIPIEAQIVGWTLESSLIPLCKQERNFPSNLPRRRDEIVNHFWVLAVSDVVGRYHRSGRDNINLWTPVRILLALSHQRPSGRPLTDMEIAQISHTRIGDVLFYLEIFSQEDFGIVANVDGKFEIAHDFLADSFLTYSGGKLRGIDRDNINYFSSIAVSHPKGFPSRTTVSDVAGWSLNDVGFGVACALILVRLGIALIGQWTGSPFKTFGSDSLLEKLALTPNNNTVQLLVPISVAAVFGMGYYHALYKDWLGRLTECKAAIRLTWGVGLISYVCGTLAIYMPAWWLPIGFIPVLAYGVKLFSLWRDFSLAEVCRRYIHSLLLTVGVSGLIIFGAGIAYARYLEEALRRPITDEIYLINFAVAVCTSLYFLHGRNLHVAPDTGIEVVGLMDR